MWVGSAREQAVWWAPPPCAQTQLEGLREAAIQAGLPGVSTHPLLQQLAHLTSNGHHHHQEGDPPPASSASPQDGAEADGGGSALLVQQAASMYMEYGRPKRPVVAEGDVAKVR